MPIAGIYRFSIHLKRINKYFLTRVEVPRKKVGKRQEVETLINEEVYLFAKYLRNERKTWNPRIIVLNREDWIRRLFPSKKLIEEFLLTYACNMQRMIKQLSNLFTEELSAFAGDCSTFLVFPNKHFTWAFQLGSCNGYSRYFFSFFCHILHSPFFQTSLKNDLSFVLLYCLSGNFSPLFSGIFPPQNL